MSTPIGSTPYARRQRRPRWVGVLVAALILMPIIEIVVLVAVGKTVGIGWTLLALLAVTLLGGWLMRREGGRAWRSLREAAQTGRMPSRELADGALVLVGGLLLLLPGFVSDIIGLVFILPFTRGLARRLLEVFVANRVLVRFGGFGPGGGQGPTQGTIRGEVVD